MTYKWATPYEWLWDQVKNNKVTVDELMDLIKNLDQEYIQEHFQSDMETDGYFDEVFQEGDEAWFIVMNKQTRETYKDSDIFWNNPDGWTYLEDATRFSKVSTQTIHLPERSEWVTYDEACELEAEALMREDPSTYE